jgi:hypothetical protein
LIKNCNMEDGQATGEATNPQQRASSTLFFWAIFAHLDPDPAEPKSMWIRIHKANSNSGVNPSVTFELHSWR